MSNACMLEAIACAKHACAAICAFNTCMLLACRGLRSLLVENCLMVLPWQEVNFYTYWAALELNPFPEVRGLASQHSWAVPCTIHLHHHVSPFTTCCHTVCVNLCTSNVLPAGCDVLQHDPRSPAQLPGVCSVSNTRPHLCGTLRRHCVLSPPCHLCGCAPWLASRLPSCCPGPGTHVL